MSDINEKSEAYNTGFEAREQHEPRGANPYPAGTFDAINWTAGWDRVTGEDFPGEYSWSDETQRKHLHEITRDDRDDDGPVSL